MRQLCLESNDDSSMLYITGDIEDIFGNRRASRYLKDTLEYTQTDNKLSITAGEISTKRLIK